MRFCFSLRYGPLAANGGYDGTDYYLNIEDVCKRVQEITGIEVNTEDDVNEALDLFNEKHEDEDMFYYLHKFECGE